MTEINHDEDNLEQRLRKHYQQRYEPPPVPSIVWSRLQADLNSQGKSASRFTQHPNWLSALAAFLVVRRHDAFVQGQAQDHLTETTTQAEQAKTGIPRFTQRKRTGRHLSHTLEAAIAVLMVVSLLLGWFAVTKWRGTQGNGSAQFTFVSQPGEVVYDSHWTPDGKHMVFALYTVATNKYHYLVWDAATGKARPTLAIQLPSSLTGKIILDSSDGRYALIRTNGTSKQAWVLKLANLLTGRVQLMYQGSYQGQVASEVPSAAFSEDSKHVAFIGADERIYRWDIAAGKAIQLTDALTTSGTDGAQWLAWSLDDKRIMIKSALVSSGKPARLQVWSVHTGHKLLDIVETPTMSLFYWPPEFGNLGGLSLDGSHILTYNKQTGVMVERESNSLKVLRTFSVQVTSPGEERVRGTPLWIANGTRFFIQKDQAIYIWDGSTGKLISTISLKDYPQPNVDIIPAGERIALWKQGNMVEIWDLVTGTKVRTIAPAISLHGAISLSPDGIYLDLNDGNQHGQIYNALTGKLITNYRGDGALLSLDGRFIVTMTNLPVSQTSINLQYVILQIKPTHDLV